MTNTAYCLVDRWLEEIELLGKVSLPNGILKRIAAPFKADLVD